MPLLHIFEQRLASAQNKGIDHELELIDQAQIHQTGYQSSAADNVHVSAQLLFQPPDIFDVSNDPCGLPGDLIEGLVFSYTPLSNFFRVSSTYAIVQSDKEAVERNVIDTTIFLLLFPFFKPLATGKFGVSGDLKRERSCLDLS